MSCFRTLQLSLPSPLTPLIARVSLDPECHMWKVSITQTTCAHYCQAQARSQVSILNEPEISDEGLYFVGPPPLPLSGSNETLNVH